jgi:hypothetical protein
MSDSIPDYFQNTLSTEYDRKQPSPVDRVCVTVLDDMSFSRANVHLVLILCIRADSLWIDGIAAVSEPGDYIGWVDCTQGLTERLDQCIERARFR